MTHDALTGALDANAKASISASLGSTAVASLSRVVFQDGDASAFELSMPSASAGEVLGEMSVQPADSAVPTTASFPFTFFDDNIALGCGECQAPSEGGAPFRVTLSNFLLSIEQVMPTPRAWTTLKLTGWVRGTHLSTAR